MLSSGKSERGPACPSSTPSHSGVYSDPKYSVTYPNGDEVQTFTVAFLVTEWSGELSVDGDEVAELGFFPVHRLPSPVYPIHLDTILDYQQSDCTFILK